MSSFLCAADERALARHARQIEQAARLLLEELPPARIALRGDPGLGTEMERLQDALGACEAAGHTLPEVHRLLGEADQLHWQLAMSGGYYLHCEAARLSSPRMGQEDLMQEGYVGLLEAARRFDPDRQLRFGTYARWWIRSQMQHTLESGGRLVRIPTSAAEDLRHLAEARRQRQARGAPAGVAGLALAVGISDGRAHFLLRQGQSVSLEETNEDGGAVQDRLAESPPDGDCEAQLIRREDLARLADAFQRTLDERERLILTRHFGLGGVPRSSLAAIGDDLRLSRERVRQMEALALRRLRVIL